MTYFSSLNPQSSTSLKENYMYNKQEPNSVLTEMSWHKVQVIWLNSEGENTGYRLYGKRAKKSHALRNLNFNEESPQMGRPQIDSDFVFY